MESREVEFSIVLHSGDQYDYSYFVPNNITQKSEVEDYLMQQAYRDKVEIEITRDSLGAHA